MPYKPQFRPFAPPPLRTPSFLPEPVYMDSEIPEEEPGLQGPPPALQSPIPQINAPIPDRPKTNVEQFDELNATRPKPIGGIRRVADAFVHHGVPGMASELLNPSAKREQYAQDVEGLLNRQKIQHQQTADDTNVAYKQSLQQDMQDRAEDRKLQREDADLNRDRTIANEGWEEVTGNRPPQMGNPGEPSMYEYGKVGGKTYRRLSAYAQTKAKKAAEQDSFEAIPDNVADVIGIPRGTKVPPAKLDAYFRIYETHQKNQAESPEAQVASRTKTADLTGLKGRDRQVYIATGRIERPANISVHTGGSSGGSQDDPKEVAAGIIDGSQPPDTKGLYRNTTAIRAELHRKGYDLATAQRDWTAINKHLATLNGPQQERLRQAVSFTYDSLDQIETLYDEWKKVGGASGVKAFNRAGLAVAKQLPGQAGAVAQTLEAQINDLTSELGTVYKGGNASTDESLRLAAENLKADWNEETFKKAIKQVRQNLQIRKNSIMNSEAVGVSQNSPYNPNRPTAPPALSAPGGVEQWERGPDGKMRRKP